MGELHRLVVASVTKRASALQTGFTLGKLAQEMDNTAFLRRIVSELQKVAINPADARSLNVHAKLLDLRMRLTAGKITPNQFVDEIRRDYDLEKSQFITANMDRIRESLSTGAPATTTPATATSATTTPATTTPETTAPETTETPALAAPAPRRLPATPVRPRDAGSYSAREIADASHPEISLMFDQFGNQYSVDRASGEASRRVSRPDGAVSWYRTPDLDFQVENGKLRPTQQTQRMGLSAANVGNVAAQLGENAFYDPRSGRYFRKDDTGNVTPVSSVEVWAIQNPVEAARRQATAERVRARSRDPQALASQARAYQAAGAPLPPSLATAIQDLTSDDYSSYAARLRGLNAEPGRRLALEEQMAAHDQLGVLRLQEQADKLREDRVVPNPGAADQRLPSASRLPGAFPAARSVGDSPQRPNVAPQGVSITPPTRLISGAPPSPGTEQAS